MGEDLVRLRLAQLLLLTLPGTPSIYYGDEIGMSGWADPDCRRAYPHTIDQAAHEHRTFVRAAIHARHEHVALRHGEVGLLAATGRAVVLERTSEGGRAVVAVNAGDEPVALQVAGSHLAELHPLETVRIGSAEVRARGGHLDLGPNSALVLVDR